MKIPTRKHVFIIEDASEAANARALLRQHSYEVSPLESAMESVDGDVVYQIRHAIPAAKMRDAQSGHTEPEPRTRADLKGNYEGIVGESPQTFEMLKFIEQVAPTRNGADFGRDEHRQGRHSAHCTSTENPARK